MTRLDSSNINSPSSNYFSVMNTLLQALGQKDPCSDIYKYANGLKQMSPEQEHTVIVQSGSENLNLSQNWPLYKSKINLFENVDNDEKGIVLEPMEAAPLRTPKPKPACKILLLFSQDGVAASNQAVALANSFSHDVSWIEEPVSLVRRSSSGGVSNNPHFPKMPKVSTGKYGC